MYALCHAHLSLVASNIDMGWYRVNYSQAEQWEWGRGQGCPFVQDRCEKTWTYPGYFCNKSNAVGCTSNRHAKGAYLNAKI